MRLCAMAFSSVVRTCSWPISSANACGLYFLAMTWYMKELGGSYARPRVIRGTRIKPLPLLPSGPGGVHSHPLHEARSLTTSHASMRGREGERWSHPASDCTLGRTACWLQEKIHELSGDKGVSRYRSA